MRRASERLYELLPAIDRIRDETEGGALKELLAVIAEQLELLEENLDQLYDDQFIETCADWVAPYIGDLIGYRALHGVAPRISSPRAEVANTIAFRRRKGTAAMLEQLARDVTDYPARVVEFFELLATTQYMNHLRPHRTSTPDLRAWEPLERIGGAFDGLARTIDVRRMATRKGRYNIPNVGLFLWRIKAFRLQDSPAFALDARRFLFSPLGIDAPLFTRPRTEDRITHIATPLEVPEPVSRRVLDASFDAYYGPGEKSLLIKTESEALPIQVCDLSDTSGGGWSHEPMGRIAIDPVLGRIAFPSDRGVPSGVSVTFHYGSAAEIGGGPYERGDTFSALAPGQALVRVPAEQATIQAALDALPEAGGIVEIGDSGRYAESLKIEAAEKASIELRAANGQRPTLMLGADLAVSGAPDATVTLNGLLITASPGALAASPGRIRIVAGASGALGLFRLVHTTLVPGLFLNILGAPQRPDTASLSIEAENVRTEVQASILGAVRVVPGSVFEARASILDSTSTTGVAYAARDGESAGGALTLNECTLVGKIHTQRMLLVSNCILLAELASAGETWTAPVRAERKQEGCVRFSWLPLSAVAPRRHRCQPEFAVTAEIERLEKITGAKLDAAARGAVRARIEAALRPAFMSLRYGRPDYALLGESCPGEVAAGASDESEMGVFHDLYHPQRLTNLRVRLEEYLRLGLEAGIFLSSPVENGGRP